MREQYGPREQSGTPDAAERSVSPDRYQAQRPVDQFIATTLHEIQQEQGRQSQRFDGLERSIDRMTDKVDRMNDASILSNSAMSRIEPQVDKHSDTLKTVEGIVKGVRLGLIVVGGIVSVVGVLLYYTNARRLDRLIKVLDSPGIEKILQKENK